MWRRALVALTLGACFCVATAFAGCSGSDASPVAAVDASDEVALVCLEGGITDAGHWQGSVALPAACALPAQGCNPLDVASCPSGACDLARDGTFACASVGAGKAGDACDIAGGSFCGAGLTCEQGRCAALCCADSDCGGAACVPLRAMQASGGHVGSCASADAGATDAGAMTGDAGTVGNHAAVYEGRGFLVPWTSWGDALAREMKWYAACPSVSGYPIWATAVHLDGTCAVTIADAIPAMQDGTGILSYLKYYIKGNRKDPSLLAAARALGDYLVHEALTPDGVTYPKFPRSTGAATAAPQAPDCGTQKDLPFEVEPDKGGIAGHALMMLAAETGDASYAAVALGIAQTLATNMTPGDDATSPWPFRVDYRNGQGRGVVNSNLSYILRLFDDLLPTHPELGKARDALWSFIKTRQIPGIACGGRLWGQFFEDGALDVNRNAWAPLSLARYLLEKQSALDPDWLADTRTLLDFVTTSFVDPVDGYPVCIEQDFDRKPFGGILSTYGAVAAMYAKATGELDPRLHAYQSLTLLVYAIDDDGCPKDQALASGRGGWQEDAHLDKVHNFMDALGAFPDWEN